MERRDVKIEKRVKRNGRNKKIYSNGFKEEKSVSLISKLYFWTLGLAALAAIVVIVVFIYLKWRKDRNNKKTSSTVTSNGSVIQPPTYEGLRELPSIEVKPGIVGMRYVNGGMGVGTSASTLDWRGDGSMNSNYAFCYISDDGYSYFSDLRLNVTSETKKFPDIEFAFDQLETDKSYLLAFLKQDYDPITQTYGEWKAIQFYLPEMLTSPTVYVGNEPNILDEEPETSEPEPEPESSSSEVVNSEPEPESSSSEVVSSEVVSSEVSSSASSSFEPAPLE